MSKSSTTDLRALWLLYRKRLNEGDDFNFVHVRGKRYSWDQRMRVFKRKKYINTRNLGNELLDISR
jgi:hypothetical protein